MNLDELEVYKKSRELSLLSWDIYIGFDWKTKKVIGDQWISSIDSIGANIAEGFGRFHFLDKNKFNYNARGSLLEAIHWTNLLFERNKITPNEYKKFNVKLDKLHLKLNNFIKSTKRQVNRV